MSINFYKFNGTENVPYEPIIPKWLDQIFLELEISDVDEKSIMILAHERFKEYLTLSLLREYIEVTAKYFSLDFYKSVGANINSFIQLLKHECLYFNKATQSNDLSTELLFNLMWYLENNNKNSINLKFFGLAYRQALYSFYESEFQEMDKTELMNSLPSNNIIQAVNYILLHELKGEEIPKSKDEIVRIGEEDIGLNNGRSFYTEVNKYRDSITRGVNHIKYLGQLKNYYTNNSKMIDLITSHQTCLESQLSKKGLL